MKLSVEDRETLIEILLAGEMELYVNANDVFSPASDALDLSDLPEDLPCIAELYREHGYSGLLAWGARLEGYKGDPLRPDVAWPAAKAHAERLYDRQVRNKRGMPIIIETIKKCP